MFRLLKLGKLGKRIKMRGPACLAQFARRSPFRLPATVLGKRGISGSAVLRAEMRTPKEVSLDAQKSCVWNEDGLLSEHALRDLSDKVREIEKTSGARVLVYAIRNLNDWPITAVKELDEFANQLRVNSFRSPEESDRAIVIALFLSQRCVQIRVGEKVRAHFSDSTNENIRNTFMVPQFKEQQIAAGLMAGLEAIALTLRHVSLDGWGAKEPKKTGWWADFKAYYRAMTQGERPVAVTALYGAGAGIFLYYLWQALKWTFCLASFSVAAWYAWKWVRHHFGQEDLVLTKLKYRERELLAREKAVALREQQLFFRREPHKEQETHKEQDKEQEKEKEKREETGSRRPSARDTGGDLYNYSREPRLRREASWWRDSGFWAPRGAPVHPDWQPPPPPPPKESEPKPEKAKSSLDGRAKAAAMGAAAAVVKRDFDEFRRERHSSQGGGGSSWSSASESAPGGSSGGGGSSF